MPVTANRVSVSVVRSAWLYGGAECENNITQAIFCSDPDVRVESGPGCLAHICGWQTTAIAGAGTQGSNPLGCKCLYANPGAGSQPLVG